VAINVIARFLKIVLVAVCTVCTPLVRAGEDPKSTKTSRETREVEGNTGFAHVKNIHAPKRVVVPTAIGQEHLKAAGLEVIGTISDGSVGLILSQVHEQLGERAARETKITGDEQYAVVELGNRERDACCFGTFLFANRQAKWVLVTEYVMSH
jgi:hypothetical protein